MTRSIRMICLAMLTIATIATIATMVGCAPSHQDATTDFSLPDELKDYKVIALNRGDGIRLYVLVKKSGEDRPVIGTMLSTKTPIHTIVIDDKKAEINGETYIKLEK